jgi:hypothetical protein
LLTLNDSREREHEALNTAPRKTPSASSRATPGVISAMPSKRQGARSSKHRDARTRTFEPRVSDIYSAS